MYGYIYLTANKVNGKVYVGQHKGSEFDRKYYGSGKILKQAINKYGIENFVCKRLEMCEDLDTLNEREIYWIAKFDSTNKKYGYNLTHGGGGLLHYEHTEKTKEKIRIANTGWNPTLETRQKMSDAKKEAYLGEGNPFYRKEHSEETKELIGSKAKERFKDKKNHPLYGKHHSEESKEKLRLSNSGKNSYLYGKTGKDHPSYGRKASDEERRAISERTKGGKNPRAKKVICIETNKVFECAMDIKIELGFDNSSIGKACKNPNKTVGGYHWMYYEDYLKLQNQEVS